MTLEEKLAKFVHRTTPEEKARMQAAWARRPRWLRFAFVALASIGIVFLAAPFLTLLAMAIVSRVLVGVFAMKAADLGVLFALLSLMAFVAAIVFLVWPRPVTRFGGRWAALGLMGGSLALFSLAGPLVAGSSPGPAASPATSGDPAAAPVAAPAPALAVGDPVGLGAVEVVITKVRSGAQIVGGGEEGKASQGGVLVAVAYSLKNVSGEPVKAFDLPRLELVDPAGVNYNPDEGKTSVFQVEHPGDRKLWSDLNPGITVRDTEIFEVSRTAFDAKTWSVRVGDGPRVKLVSAS